MKKVIIAAIWSLILVAALTAIFALTKYQFKIISQISALFNPEAATSSASPIPSPSPSPSGPSPEEQEIAKLRQEIEELKKKPPQIIYKTVLTPASPTPDLKTQQDLEKAKQQISSLEQQLQQLQTQQQSQPAAQPLSDAELIKSWQASEKVAQVACENKFLGSWQLGSGALISADGKLLTNQHVVQPSIGIFLPDYCLILFTKDFNPQTQTYQKQYRATITGFFQDRDAALLKIQDIIWKDQMGVVQTALPGGSFQYFEIATSTNPQIGDAVYVVGFPESAKFAFSVTKGIISNLTSEGIYFGTDAQIDRGNSGGAALNRAGQLIGLPTWKYVGAGDYRGYILNIQTIKLN